MEAQEITVRKAASGSTSANVRGKWRYNEQVLAKLSMDVLKKAQYCEQIVTSTLAPPSTSELRLQVLGTYVY